MREHALSETHKLAVAVHREPDKLVRILLQSSLDDEQLVYGAVPQPADWRVSVDPVSWAQAGEQAGTEHYIAQIRERSVKPRAFQAMVFCIREALRIKKRKWLEEAKWIFLGFDDKNGREPCDSSAISATLPRASTPRTAVRRVPAQRATPLGCNTELA